MLQGEIINGEEIMKRWGPERISKALRKAELTWQNKAVVFTYKCQWKFFGFWCYIWRGNVD